MIDRHSPNHCHQIHLACNDSTDSLLEPKIIDQPAEFSSQDADLMDDHTLHFSNTRTLRGTVPDFDKVRPPEINQRPKPLADHYPPVKFELTR